MSDPTLRDQIASAIGSTMILRTSVDEITEAVMRVVQPHLKHQISDSAEVGADRLDDTEAATLDSKETR